MRLWKQRENPSILIFHQLNRAHHNATLAQMARNHLQDVGNPMLLFILPGPQRSRRPPYPARKSWRSCSMSPPPRWPTP